MLSNAARPSSTASTIGRTVVQEHQVGGRAATSVPAMPIATPMSAWRSAGASLTPSPVIATTSPAAWSALTMPSFCSGVRGRRPRSAPRRSPRARRSSAGSSSPSSTPSSPMPWPGDGGGGRRVVAGDHHDADARLPAALDRLRDSGRMGSRKPTRPSSSRSRSASPASAGTVSRSAREREHPVPWWANCSPLHARRSSRCRRPGPRAEDGFRRPFTDDRGTLPSGQVVDVS